MKTSNRVHKNGSTRAGATQAAANRPLSHRTIISELRGVIGGYEFANTEPADGKIHDIGVLKAIAALKAAIEIVKSN